MTKNNQSYEWSVKEVVELQTAITSIQSDVRYIKSSINTPSSIKDTFSDWKTLVIASLTILGAIIALRQGM